MKICPYCAETIKIEAVKCKHCYSNLTNNNQLKQATDIVIIRIFKIGILFFIAIWVLVSLLKLSQSNYADVDNDIKEIELGIKAYEQAIEDAKDSTSQLDMRPQVAHPSTSKPNIIKHNQKKKEELQRRKEFYNKIYDSNGNLKNVY